MDASLEQRLQEAVRLIVATHNPSKIILFGSLARGEGQEDSDIDLMIVKDTVKNRADEIVEVGRLLSPLRLALDIIVVDAKTFHHWADTPGNVYYEAYSSGRTLYDQAA